MLANADAALAFVFRDEGGYAERDTEGGGAVNMGVTFAVFLAWRFLNKRPVPSFADLKAMPIEEAKAIYKAQYLDGVHFNDLPSGVDYCVLDGAINGGVTGSLKILQMALKLRPVDGHYGLITKWAASHRPVPELIDRICNERLAKYKRLDRFNVVANPEKPAPKQITWGKVWSNRIEEVRKRAHAMEGV